MLLPRIPPWVLPNPTPPHTHTDGQGCELDFVSKHPVAIFHNALQKTAGHLKQAQLTCYLAHDCELWSSWLVDCSEVEAQSSLCCNPPTVELPPNSDRCLTCWKTRAWKESASFLREKLHWVTSEYSQRCCWFIQRWWRKLPKCTTERNQGSRILGQTFFFLSKDKSPSISSFSPWKVYGSEDEWDRLLWNRACFSHLNLTTVQGLLKSWWDLLEHTCQRGSPGVVNCTSLLWSLPPISCRYWEHFPCSWLRWCTSLSSSKSEEPGKQIQRYFSLVSMVDINDTIVCLFKRWWTQKVPGPIARKQHCTVKGDGEQVRCKGCDLRVDGGSMENLVIWAIFFFFCAKLQTSFNISGMIADMGIL